MTTASRFGAASLAATLAAVCSVASLASAQQVSQLWGEHGEKWSPTSRLPDFSFAGYRFGEASIPTVKATANVRDFGAKGDGETDDTEAFLRAIEKTDSGAILIPAGRYKISKGIEIKKPNLVLRGEGTDKTVLLFPVPLEELNPKPTQNTGGRPTSGYSWSGGLIWIKGEYGMKTIAPITTDAQRGDRVITLGSAPGALKVGDRVSVEMQDDESQSLLAHVYAGDRGDTKNIKPMKLNFVSRVAAIDGAKLTLERPLRLDIRQAWKPTLRTFNPTVSECGVEELSIEFPNTPYKGHFTEVGYNGIAINGASDCWVRSVRIVNSDSGIFASGMFCTVDGVVIESQRQPNGNTTGHHGLTAGTDVLITNFDLRTRFIHDISLEGRQAGNVIKNGKGIDLALDHHRRAPHGNLFTNIDLGAGTRMYHSGGGAALGKHAAAWNTFWNIRAARDQRWPKPDFAPDLINLVGVRTNSPSVLEPDGKWFEAIPPDQLQPPDLHAAQLKRRLESTR